MNTKISHRAPSNELHFVQLAVLLIIVAACNICGSCGTSGTSDPTNGTPVYTSSPSLNGTNTGTGGKSGRRKFTLTDWDGTGTFDILINSNNAERWKQTGTRDGKWLFKNVGNLDTLNLAGHDTSPTTVDWNHDGIPDLLLGAEDGRALIASADAVMAAEGIRNPARMTAMFLSGKW